MPKRQVCAESRRGNPPPELSPPDEPPPWWPFPPKRSVQSARGITVEFKVVGAMTRFQTLCRIGSSVTNRLVLLRQNLA
jgi:hypothetical protein